jgi:hypothetical protein
VELDLDPCELSNVLGTSPSAASSTDDLQTLEETSTPTGFSYTALRSRMAPQQAQLRFRKRSNAASSPIRR